MHDEPEPTTTHRGIDRRGCIGYRASVSADLETAMRTVLARGPAVRFAALFGSRARGTARPDSDIDVAWLPADANLPLGAELELQAELTRVAGHEVDLVRLDHASSLLRFEVARDGVLLFGTPSAFTGFRVEAIAEWLDYEPAFRAASERFRRRLAAGASVKP